jgi:hypothetical protein
MRVNFNDRGSDRSRARDTARPGLAIALVIGLDALHFP